MSGIAEVLIDLGLGLAKRLASDARDRAARAHVVLAAAEQRIAERRRKRVRVKPFENREPGRGPWV